jgi:hypothetical protein
VNESAIEAIAVAEARVREGGALLETAKDALTSALSELGLAIANDRDPIRLRETVRLAREAVDEREAALPHLENALVEAKRVHAASERARREAKMRLLASERLRIADELELATSEFLALAERSASLGDELHRMAAGEGTMCRDLSNRDRVQRWIGNRLNSLFVGKFSYHPDFDRPFAALERATLGELVNE